MRLLQYGMCASHCAHATAGRPCRHAHFTILLLAACQAAAREAADWAGCRSAFNGHMLCDEQQFQVRDMQRPYLLSHSQILLSSPPRGAGSSLLTQPTVWLCWPPLQEFFFGEVNDLCTSAVSVIDP